MGCVNPSRAPRLYTLLKEQLDHVNVPKSAVNYAKMSI